VIYTVTYDLEGMVYFFSAPNHVCSATYKQIYKTHIHIHIIMNISCICKRVHSAALNKNNISLYCATEAVAGLEDHYNTSIMYISN